VKNPVWFASASLALVLLPALQGEPHCPGNVPSIRPRFVERSIIIVPVTLNGSGPYDFVLDTAAQVTTVDPALASELHLKLEGTAGVDGAGFSTRASYAHADMLRAGEYTVKDALVLVHSLGQIQLTDRRVRGILGENFLERFDLLIDYPHGIVCLDDSRRMQGEVRGERVTLEASRDAMQNLPFTEPLTILARISGRQVLLQLDSGVNAPLLFHADNAARKTSLQSTGTDGVKRAYDVLPPEDIQLGKRSFRQISFVVPPSPGEGIRDSKIDGVLPTILFSRAFISYADRFAVLESW
jgi:Aspartyl protease